MVVAALVDGRVSCFSGLLSRADDSVISAAAAIAATLNGRFLLAEVSALSIVVSFEAFCTSDGFWFAFADAVLRMCPLIAALFAFVGRVPSLTGLSFAAV